MDEVLITLVFLLIVFSWRGLSNMQNRFSVCVQNVLHKCGPLAWCFQWYSLLLIGITLLLLRTFYDVVRFEYIASNFLLKPALAQQPGYIPNLTEGEKEAMEITPWLRILSLAAPVFGVLAGVIVILHAVALIKANAGRKATQRKWYVSRELNMVILVIVMPIVFIVMAMRAEIRAWAVMTGTAWKPFHNGPQPPPKSWDDVQTIEMATYTTDLELAGFFQYLTIFSFGRLCVGYLRNAPPQYRFALKFAGLQGVYLYVIFGACRSAFTFVQAVISSNPKLQLYGATIQTKVLDFIGPIFTAATILCVYNMLIICRMKDVTDRLGSANLKFQATRALVLISQVQQGVLLGLVVGSPLYMQLQKEAVPAFIRDNVDDWSFSPLRAKLMHAALLNFECFLVVIMNCFAWGRKEDYSTEEGNENMQPLLQT